MDTKVSIIRNDANDINITSTSKFNEMDLSIKLSKIFSYGGNDISFIKTSYGILLNATQMAKIFKKKPVEYLRLSTVNQLIKSMVGFMHLSENQIVTTIPGSPENGGGTWMYEDLAIDFARWLDSGFRLWCNAKIKEVLTSNQCRLPDFTNPADAAEAWAREYRRAEIAEKIAIEERSRSIQIENEKNQAIKMIEKQRPDVEFSKSFKVPGENDYLIRDVAKRLEQNGIIVADKNLRLYLEETKFMFRNGRGEWELYSNVVKKGYGKYRLYFKDEYSGEKVYKQTIYMTGSGYEVTLKAILGKFRKVFEKYGRIAD